MPRPNAWPYRDYVIRAFNEDMPYARFVLEQLAGDALGEDAATGFLVGGARLLPGQIGKDDGIDSARQRQDELDDMVSTTSTAFLGLTVGCARCHDHKFDPIPQTDYYGFRRSSPACSTASGRSAGDDATAPARASATSSPRELAQVELALDERRAARLGTVAASPRRAGVKPGRNVERFAPVEARIVRLRHRGDERRYRAVHRRAGSLQPRSRRRGTSRWPPAGPASHGVGHVSASSESTGSSTSTTASYGNGRSWISSEPGKGWVQIELPEPARIDRVVWGRDREGRYQRPPGDGVPHRGRRSSRASGRSWPRRTTARDGRTPQVRVRPPTREDQSRRRCCKRQAELRRRLAELPAEPTVYAGVFQRARADVPPPPRRPDAAARSGRAGRLAARFARRWAR